MRPGPILLAIAALLALASAGAYLFVFSAPAPAPGPMPVQSPPDPPEAQAQNSSAANAVAADTNASASDATSEQEDAPTVEIPDEVRHSIGVQLAEAKVQPLTRAIRTVGNVDVDERRLYAVNTKFEVWIEKLYVDYTGRQVKKGEPLAEVYSPELLATENEYLSTLRWAGSISNTPASDTSDLVKQDAANVVKAARERLRLWDITEAQIKRIEKTGKPIRTLTIYAPANGVVMEKMAVEGSRAMPGEKLLSIADLSHVWVIADIYESEIPLIRVGQSAVIKAANYSGLTFTSRVDYIYPVLSGSTRTARVRFDVPNPTGELRPEMYTDIEVEVNIGKRLAIPRDAIIDTGARKVVYVDKGDGYFEPREVSTGISTGDFVEVTHGLSAGDKVAATASFLIDSEAQFKGVTPLPARK